MKNIGHFYGKKQQQHIFGKNQPEIFILHLVYLGLKMLRLSQGIALGFGTPFSGMSTHYSASLPL